MSFVITHGVNNGFPYIPGIPVPPQTPELIPPYPGKVFYSNGGELPVFLPYGTIRLTLSELYSAENIVDTLYFGENEIQTAYLNDEEVFRVCWF